MLFTDVYAKNMSFGKMSKTGCDIFYKKNVRVNCCSICSFPGNLLLKSTKHYYLCACKTYRVTFLITVKPPLTDTPLVGGQFIPSTNTICRSGFLSIQPPCNSNCFNRTLRCTDAYICSLNTLCCNIKT